MSKSLSAAGRVLRVVALRAPQATSASSNLALPLGPSSAGHSRTHSGRSTPPAA